MVWLGAAFILGLIFGRSLHLNWLVPLLFLVLSIFLFILELTIGWRFSFIIKWRNFAPIPISALLLSLALGGFRFSFTQKTFTPQDLAFFNGSNYITLIARINSIPLGSASSIQFVAKAITVSSPSGIQTRKLNGLLQVRVPKSVNLRYGDLLLLEGNLAMPQSSDTFNYQEYLAQHGIYSIMAYPDFQVFARNTGNPFMTFLNVLACMPTIHPGIS